ncbi:Anaphase-promoting complex component Cut20/Apc4 [Phytophthora palmivora]|uniref:Anaphase-promoting complex subunit 4 n=1 Tax=Phytophthora palmivora TaxID=4796 RepID=A0A2P4YSR9_9STRA|nr:Anaphase-promoting complex component Cut20/Apc4 [Phytophthora palmivora]
MTSKRAFVALQDRFVSSLAVACCPTMDLIAVLTLDHHLLVHRTTSWQKLLHIKPSDVGFEMLTLTWKPDGLQLAVGCDEGNVAIFEIESGEILPERSSNFRHEHCITAMHWTKLSELRASTFNSSNKRRRGNVSGKDWSSSGLISQSKLQFRRRSSRFLQGYNEETTGGDDTILVTADERGFIALWWMGRVLLTRIDVSKYFAEEEFQVMESMGCQRSDTSCFRIERVDLAPDLSLLFVLLAFSSDRSNQDAGIDGSSATKLHRMMTLDMTAIQHVNEDVALVASSVDQVQAILSRIATVCKQMVTEWKNATRIFELKMGLIGSLYEKYACEDPPQVDMLSVVVTGITAPALAQYFAQDIQEMSVHRMQKALFSGYHSLRTLVDERLKRDLADLLFLLSELRGHAKWNTQAYAGTFGITVSALGDLVQTTQDALVEVEALTLALHETHQDFALFFQWILERIRIHTNASQSGGGTGPTGITGTGAGGAVQGSKSLLNMRRLCDFLQRAAESAQLFRKQQPSHNQYKVETTFGNLVSAQLTAFAKSDVGKSSVGCLARIQDQWYVLLDVMAVTIAQTTVREASGCFTIGTSNNTVVEECHIHFRQPFSTRTYIDAAEIDDLSDDENGEEAVDWNSLRHYGPIIEDQYARSVPLIGFRLQSGVVLLLRAFCDEDHPSKALSHLTWEAALVNFSEPSASGTAPCRGFDFYGDLATDKKERLAFVVDRFADDRMHQGTKIDSCYFWNS